MWSVFDFVWNIVGTHSQYNLCDCGPLQGHGNYEALRLYVQWGLTACLWVLWPIFGITVNWAEVLDTSVLVSSRVMFTEMTPGVCDHDSNLSLLQKQLQFALTGRPSWSLGEVRACLAVAAGPPWLHLSVSCYRLCLSKRKPQRKWCKAQGEIGQLARLLEMKIAGMGERLFLLITIFIHPTLRVVIRNTQPIGLPVTVQHRKAPGPYSLSSDSLHSRKIWIILRKKIILLQN